MATFTLEQSKKIYQDAKAKGLDAKKVMYLMAKDGAVFDGANMDDIVSYGQKNYEPKPIETKKSFKQNTQEDIQETGKGIKGAVTERVGKIKESISEYNKGNQSYGEAVGQTAVNIARTPFDIAGQLIKGGVKGILSQKGEDKLKGTIAQSFKTADDILSKYETLKETDPVLAGGVNILFGYAPDAVLSGKELYKNYQELKETNPRAARNMEALFGVAETALDIGGLGVAKAGTTALKEGGEQIIKSGSKQVSNTIAKAGTSVANITEPIRSVSETVGATLGSAARRGKETIKEGILESQRVSRLPEPEKLAVRSGLDQGVVDFVKTSSKSNIPIYEKIISAAKSGAGSLRNGTAAKQIVGKELIEKVVKPALQIRDTIGSKIGTIVQKLPTIKKDIKPFVDEFTQALENVGVTVGEKGKLIAGSGAVVGDLPAYQNMFNRIENGVASQKDLHDIRSAVFKEFNLAKSRQQAFSESADRVAEQFRSILAKGITDKNYMKYSKEYADVMNKLTDFVKYTGHKGDIEKLTAKELRLAEIAQRTLGNASSRPQEVMDAIISLADKSGKKGLGKDLSDAIRFSDLMEDFYGIQQTRSLAGQVARGTKAGVEGATESLLQNASTGGITGVISTAVKGILGKTTAEQQRALENLIKSLKVGK
jgi:hypothetical protein